MSKLSDGTLFWYETLKSYYKLKIKREQNCVMKHKTTRGNFLSSIEANDYIYTALREGRPFFAGRFGNGEILIINRYLMIKYGIVKQYKDAHLSSLIFPGDEATISRFAALNLEASRNLDLLAQWSLVCDNYIRKTTAKNAKICSLSALEPYCVNNPWSYGLEGKRVVVISPFSKSIREQFAKREYIFKDKRVLPDFQLRTIQSIMILSGQTSSLYHNWFEALDYLYDETCKTDFDVAILGCGPYSMPLASMIKDMGKQVINMGGATQILFGIRGRRWDQQSFFQGLYNDSWIYPIEMPPENSEILDSSCYWK